MNPASDSFVSSTSSDGEGVNIIWSPEDLAELEKKVAELTKENAKMKSEIEEMKELMKTDGISQSPCTSDGCAHRKSVTFDNGRTQSLK